MKDLRKDFNYSSKSFKMSKGHEQKFKKQLDETFGSAPKKDYSVVYKMAAVAIIAVISTVFIINQTQFTPNESSPEITQVEKISLGDISPELDNIENFYMTSIKMELATLETSSKFDDVINSYLDELKSINKAYSELESELNTVGVSEEIINAMIDNLKLRLELLQDLKQKLNNLNQKQNDKDPVYQI